jgi:hypothetical protein
METTAKMAIPTVDASSEAMTQATEKLWQEAVSHLNFTNNEILLPMNIVNTLGFNNVEVLRTRLG